jgi:putative DNA primase/helicase
MKANFEKTPFAKIQVTAVLAAENNTGQALSIGASERELRKGLDDVGLTFTTPAVNESQPRFEFLSPKALRSLPNQKWLVQKLLPEQGFACIYGASGAGKSFIALDLGASIAAGKPWCGFNVKQTPVVFCVLEGQPGFKNRAAAWEAKNGELAPGFLTSLRDFDLTNLKDVREFSKLCPRGAVVFIDTLNRAAPAWDENSSKDMGAIIAGAKLLQTLIYGLVILVAHTGKDSSKGLRGHSSLPAALDAMILVTSNSRGAEWEVTKAKDGVDGLTCPFKLAIQACGELDQDGEPITSCVVEFDPSSVRTKPEKTPGGANQVVAMKVLKPLFEKAESDKPGAPSGRQCIHFESAVEAVMLQMAPKVVRRHSRAKEAIQGLVAREILGLENGWLWLE